MHTCLQPMSVVWLHPRLAAAATPQGAADRYGIEEEEGAGASHDSQVSVPAPHLCARSFGSGTLLQLTDDTQLAYSREQLLRKAGLHVVTARSTDVLHGSSLPAAIALFCQSVRRERAVHLAELLRAAGKVVTVRLSFTPVLDEDAFDVVLPTPVPPAMLMREATRWTQIHENGFTCVRVESAGERAHASRSDR